MATHFIHAPIKCVHNFEVKVDLGKVLAVHLIRISNHIPIKTHTSLSLSLSGQTDALLFSSCC